MRVLSPHIPLKFAGTQSTVAVGNAASTQILPANTARMYLLLQNNGANNIHVSLDGTSATTSDFVIASGGGSLELAVGVPTGQINGIAVSASTDLVVLEG